MRVQIWKGVVIVVGVVSLLAAGPVWADEGDMVAIFKIKGAMPEAPDMMGMGALFGGEEPTNMFDLLKHLKHARGDKSLRACVFEIEDAALGLGQIQELRAQFKALRAADKDVLVYAETLHNGTLLLGSAASELVLMPRGEVAFIGMYGEGLYFKNLLEKIGLQADIIHCGAYKSAGEPLYRTGPSPEADEQTNRLLDSEFQQLLDEIADSRGLTPDRVRELVDVGLFSGKEALDAKLVDKLEYREQFIEGVKKRYGGGTKFVSDYGQKDKTTIDLADPFAFFKLFSNVMKG